MTSAAAANPLVMNALCCLVILHCLILYRWRRCDGLRRWFQECQKFLHSIEARQYTFEGADERFLLAVFEQLIRAGQLQPQAVRSLLTWIRALEKADAERLRVGYGSSLRLGLAAGLGLLTSLILDGTWFLRLSDNPPALLLLLGESLILALWLKQLKAHPLATSMSLQANFTRAWLGQSREGPWHQDWLNLHQRGQVTGRDLGHERKELLEDWVSAGIQEQEKRLTWAEDLFGLVELAGSVYFLGTACTLPLLKLWGG